MNEAQTRFNKIDPKLRDDQREDDQRDRSLIFFQAQRCQTPLRPRSPQSSHPQRVSGLGAKVPDPFAPTGPVLVS